MNLSNVNLSEIPGFNEARPLITGAKVSLNPNPKPSTLRPFCGSPAHLWRQAKPETPNPKPQNLNPRSSIGLSKARLLIFLAFSCALSLSRSCARKRTRARSLSLSLSCSLSLSLSPSSLSYLSITPSLPSPLYSLSSSGCCSDTCPGNQPRNLKMARRKRVIIRNRVHLWMQKMASIQCFFDAIFLGWENRISDMRAENTVVISNKK